jgi:hypothetical protein
VAVTLVSVAPSATGFVSTTASVTTGTWNHTVAAGTDRYLLVGVSLGGTAAGATGTCSATFGGVAMTQLQAARMGGTGNGKAYLFGLAAPAVSTGAVVITSSATARITGGSVNFTGATNGVGTAVVSSGSSASAAITVPGTISGNIVFTVAGGGSGFNATTPTTGTLAWRATGDTASSGGNSVGATAAGGGDITITDTLSADDWGMVGIELLAATSPPARRSSLNLNQAVKVAAFY